MLYPLIANAPLLPATGTVVNAPIAKERAAEAARFSFDVQSYQCFLSAQIAL
jgi:hypothetical protein